MIVGAFSRLLSRLALSPVRGSDFESRYTVNVFFSFHKATDVPSPNETLAMTNRNCPTEKLRKN